MIKKSFYCSILQSKGHDPKIGSAIFMGRDQIVQIKSNFSYLY